MPERSDGTPRGTIVNPTPVTQLLHKYRAAAGWPSCRAIAAKAGISPSTVSLMVTGRKTGTMASALLITQVLGGDTDAIRRAWADGAARYGSRVQEVQFDNETHAMEQIVRLFAELEPAARGRVLAYLHGRFPASSPEI